MKRVINILLYPLWASLGFLVIYNGLGYINIVLTMLFLYSLGIWLGLYLDRIFAIGQAKREVDSIFVFMCGVINVLTIIYMSKDIGAFHHLRMLTYCSFYGLSILFSLRIITKFRIRLVDIIVIILYGMIFSSFSITENGNLSPRFDIALGMWIFTLLAHLRFIVYKGVA